jgi:hypothetical protein
MTLFRSMMTSSHSNPRTTRESGLIRIPGEIAYYRFLPFWM